jgi:hypothetical protein
MVMNEENRRKFVRHDRNAAEPDRMQRLRAAFIKKVKAGNFGLVGFNGDTFPTPMIMAPLDKKLEAFAKIHHAELAEAEALSAAFLNALSDVCKTQGYKIEKQIPIPGNVISERNPNLVGYKIYKDYARLSEAQHIKITAKAIDKFLSLPIHDIKVSGTSDQIIPATKFTDVEKRRRDTPPAEGKKL